MKCIAGIVAVLTCAALAGCVERRFVIDSQPPTAQVLLNGQPIGFTPVDAYFVYYGEYEFTLVKDGYETRTYRVAVPPPWYEVPPLDFFSENLIPFTHRDVRRFTFVMEPVQVRRTDEITQRAEQLRGQGKLIGEQAPVAPPPGLIPAPAAETTTPPAGPPESQPPGQ